MSADLAQAHWRALRGERRSEAAGLLARLRRTGTGADPHARRALAAALARASWDAARWNDPSGAGALLDELRAHCRRAETEEAERFELAKALAAAHWDAVRYGRATPASRLLAELRALAGRREATEGQRVVLAQALANEIRLHAGARGDRARAEGLLRELGALAGRPHAVEEQRDALARALLDLHHQGNGAEETAGAERVQALRVLAARASSTPAQHLAYVEALQDAPWRSGPFGNRARQDALLAAVDAALAGVRGTPGAAVRLADALVRMHAKVRRARDDAFADAVLDRLRALVVRPDSGLETWLALATAVCDGLWIAGTFGNRELAEELIEILNLLTGPVRAGPHQRMALAGLLVGAHHRAVRHEDAYLAKSLLTLLYAWALRPEATAEERAVLAHGLALADAHAKARGDAALAARIETALGAVGPAPAGPAPGALAELAARE